MLVLFPRVTRWTGNVVRRPTAMMRILMCVKYARLAPFYP